jgi:putative hydrolase of the HAD superfamily
MAIELVVFDLGGVMITLAQGWADAARLAGVPYRGFTETPERRAAWQALEARLGSGDMATADYFAAVRDVVGTQYRLDEIAAMYQAVIQPEQPGILALVHGLQAAGYRTACLSNTSAPHWVDLTNPRLYPAICALDARHASHLLGVMKPDPAIYRRFEAEMGAAPETILFFDDLLANVDAARACGWHAEQITPDRPPVAQMLDTLAAFGVAL